MNQDLQRIAQEFAERRAVRHVVHTSETVQQFADLTARVVEQTEGTCLDMFMQIGMHGAILTRLMENASYEPRQEPIAEVRMNIPDDVMRNAMRAPARMRWDIPNLPEMFFNGSGRIEYACRVPADYQAYVETVESFVKSLALRRVVTSQEPPNRYSSEYDRRFHLTVNSEPLPEMSLVARITTEALQQGIPLGETEPRPARMQFVRYNAGQGNVGQPAENGYVLMRQNDIYIVPTLNRGTDLFLMDENSRVTRALNVLERMCYFCDSHISYQLDERLEATLSGQDLNGRRVFFVASTNRGDDSSDRLPDAIEMLERRGAQVYATVDEAKGLF